MSFTVVYLVVAGATLGGIIAVPIIALVNIVMFKALVWQLERSVK